MRIVDTVLVFVYGLLILAGMLWCAARFATPLHAAELDWKPYAVLAAGQGLDTLTTLRPTPNCIERNPLLGPHPSAVAVLVPKLAIIGGISLLVRFTEQRESRAARIIAKSAAYVGGMAGAKDGLHNLRTCGW
jgi:hypothetical protein